VTGLRQIDNREPAVAKTDPSARIDPDPLIVRSAMRNRADHSLD
jgi:hypothetical protein